MGMGIKVRRQLIGRASGIAIAATIGAAFLLAWVPADAVAQAGESLKPPSVNESDDPPTIRMYLVTALLGALVVGANLIPSKRGHQD